MNNNTLIIIAGTIMTVIVILAVMSINYRRLKQIRRSLEIMVYDAEKHLVTDMEFINENELILTNSGKELLKLQAEIKTGKLKVKDQVLYYKTTSSRNSSIALIAFAVIVTALFVVINNISNLSIQNVWVLTLPSFLVFTNWILQFSVRKPRRSSWRLSFATR